MTHGPLAGRRVVVTRRAEQAGPLVERLRALGAIPVEIPLIDIVDPTDGGAALRDALDRLDEFAWIVVTSPNGASRVRDALAGKGESPRVAAVGTETAAVLGVPADLIPRTQTAEALAAALAAHSPANTAARSGEHAAPTGEPNARLLLIEPERDQDQAPSPLHRALIDQGWTIMSVEAYRTVSVVPSGADLLRVLSADAALFASGSAVRSWVDVFGTQAPAVTAAIGPSTAQVAADLGLKIDVIAADHSTDGLVDGLVAYFADAV